MEMLCERSNMKYASGFYIAGGLAPVIELFKHVSYSIFHIKFHMPEFPRMVTDTFFAFKYLCCYKVGNYCCMLIFIQYFV